MNPFSRLFAVLTFALLSFCSAGQQLQSARSFIATQTQINQSEIALDCLGNTWMSSVISSEMEFPDLGRTINKDWKTMVVLYRINAKGKVDRLMEFGYAWYNGMPAFGCAPNNDLWVFISISGTMHLDMGTEKVEVTGQGRWSNALVIVSPEGKIKTAKAFDESAFCSIYPVTDIDFTSKGECHLIIPRKEEKREIREGRTEQSYAYMHLHHFLLDTQGEVLKNDDLYIGNDGTDFHASNVCVTIDDDFYITASYRTNITMNGKEIVPDKNPPRDTKWGDDHAVLLHFDAESNFTWYRTIFGYGGQYIRNITTDANNVYITGYFNYEYGINSTNEITLENGELLNHGGMFIACAGHNGRVKWTNMIPTLHSPTQTTDCGGLETDGKGQLLYFMLHSDSLDIPGKDKVLHIRKPGMHTVTSCVLIGDTLGNFIDLRQDIVHTKGQTFTMGSAAQGDLFAVTGFYLGEVKGFNYSENDQAYLDSKTFTDLQVVMGNKKGPKFMSHRSSGGVYTYSFRQPPLPAPAQEVIASLSPADRPYTLNTDHANCEFPTTEQLLADTIFGFPDVTIVEDQEWIPHSIPLPEGTVDEYLVVPGVEEVVQAGEVNVDSTQVAGGSLADEEINEEISAAAAAPALSIFPNPARGPLSIQAEGVREHCTLMIHDMQGQMMVSQSRMLNSDNASFTLNTSTWSGGTYTATVISEGGSMVKRFVVSR